MGKEKAVEGVNLTITTPKMYEVTIKGMGSILFNKCPDLSKTKTDKPNQEKIDKTELEYLNWRKKCYFEDDGIIYIPGENIHECLKEGSQYWGCKIPGEGNKTYTDVIKSAVVCENLNFGISKDDMRILPFGKNCNGNPSKGKKSMVYKIRPMLPTWGGTFRIHVFDGRLSVSILRTIITYAGTFRGLGDWRPIYGRFELVDIHEV